MYTYNVYSKICLHIKCENLIGHEAQSTTPPQFPQQAFLIHFRSLLHASPILFHATQAPFFEIPIGT